MKYHIKVSEDTVVFRYMGSRERLIEHAKKLLDVKMEEHVWSNGDHGFLLEPRIQFYHVISVRKYVYVATIKKDGLLPAQTRRLAKKLLATMTKDEKELVRDYGSDPRWKNVDGLINYMNKTPLTKQEKRFYNRLLKAMRKAES